MRETDLRLKYFSPPNHAITFIFEKKKTFFLTFQFSHLTFGTGTTRYSSDDHISAILAARRSKFARSSSGWPSGQPGIHDFVFGRHDSELFRGTKKVKIQHSQIGLKFSNLANSVLRTRKSEKLKKNFFLWRHKFFFSIFFQNVDLFWRKWTRKTRLAIGRWRKYQASSQTGGAGGW